MVGNPVCDSDTDGEVTVKEEVVMVERRGGMRMTTTEMVKLVFERDAGIILDVSERTAAPSARGTPVAR